MVLATWQPHWRITESFLRDIATYLPGRRLDHCCRSFFFLWGQIWLVQSGVNSAVWVEQRDILVRSLSHYKCGPTLASQNNSSQIILCRRRVLLTSCWWCTDLFATPLFADVRLLMYRYPVLWRHYVTDVTSLVYDVTMLWTRDFCCWHPIYLGLCWIIFSITDSSFDL